MRTLKIAAAIVAVTGASLLAQNRENSLVEVSSVKPVRQPVATGPIRFSPDGFNVPSTTVAQLIGVAYQVQNYQVITGEDWVRSEQFSVSAKMRPDAPGAAGGESVARMTLMVQAVLAQRFKLRVRNESRMLPTYSLVMASENKALGPKLAASLVECTKATPAGTQARQRCGLQVFPNRLLGVSVSLDSLSNVLSGRVDRPVLNETGLRGLFDYDVTWALDNAPSPNAARAGDQSSPATATVAPTGPSIFTALQEQLGLKLEPARAPVNVLVIDHIERPTED